MKKHMYIQIRDDIALNIAPEKVESLEDKSYRILIDGNENDIVRELAGHDIVSMNIEQVSLRDIFQKYYGEDE